MTEGKAVGFGHLIYVIGRDESGGPRHVLHNNGGVTWDMFPYMTGNDPRISIIATARRGADDDANRLALVERLLCGDRRSELQSPTYCYDQRANSLDHKRLLSING